MREASSPTMANWRARVTSRLPLRHQGEEEEDKCRDESGKGSRSEAPSQPFTHQPMFV